MCEPVFRRGTESPRAEQISSSAHDGGSRKPPDDPLQSRPLHLPFVDLRAVEEPSLKVCRAFSTSSSFKPFINSRVVSGVGVGVGAGVGVAEGDAVGSATGDGEGDGCCAECCHQNREEQ